MSDEVGERLRDLLKRRVEAAAEEAVRDGGEASARSTRSIERVARLLERYESRTPPRRRSRWSIAAAFAATLLIVSLLVALRVPTTEIELDASLSEVAFVSSVRQKLTEAVAVSGVGVSGLQGIEIPRSRGVESRHLQFPDGAASGVRFDVLSDGERRGSMNLDPLLVPASTRVRLRGTAPLSYRLSLIGAATEIRATVHGPIQVAHADGGIERLDFPAPKVLVLRGRGGAVDLDLTFLSSAANAMSPQLEVAHLSLLRVDEANAAGRSFVRHVSTISEGTLYLESLNGRKHVLRPNEVLQFDRSEGEIRALRLEPDRGGLRFHGRVRGMTIGAGEARRSLMPTWLEWLKERHGLSLFWGSSLYLFGLLAAVLRWWGKPS